MENEKAICYAIMSPKMQEDQHIMNLVTKFRIEHKDLNVIIVTPEQLNTIGLKKHVDRQSIQNMLKDAKFNAEMIIKSIDYEPVRELPDLDDLREQKKHFRNIQRKHDFKPGKYRRW